MGTAFLRGITGPPGISLLSILYRKPSVFTLHSNSRFMWYYLHAKILYNLKAPFCFYAQGAIDGHTKLFSLFDSTLETLFVTQSMPFSKPALAL